VDEAVGERRASEADALLALEQVAERAADRQVLGLDELDAQVAQGFEPPPRAPSSPCRRRPA
jgi:hypothetical protein